MATSKLGPAGSLEPISAGKGKWTDDLGALELSTLAGLATDINKTVDQTVKHVARGKIKVGKLLLEARSQFRDNNAAFGKWRVENTSVQSKQHAHYLMQVAEQFGNATVLIEGANYSVMQELVTADQAAIQWVVDKVDKGEPPTVAEVREKVQESKGTSKKGVTSPGVGTIKIPNANINAVVKMSLTRRIQEVVERGIKGIEGDLVILGMDPDPQTPCHKETLNAIRDYWQENVEHGDELAAVRASYERVYEEFDNWS